MKEYRSVLINAKQPITQSEEMLREGQSLYKFLQLERETLKINKLQLVGSQIMELGENSWILRRCKGYLEPEDMLYFPRHLQVYLDPVGFEKMRPYRIFSKYSELLK